MKLRASVVAIAMKIEEELQRHEASLKSFEKSFGSKHSDPWISRVDLKIRHVDKESASIFGKKVDCDVTNFVSIEV